MFDTAESAALWFNIFNGLLLLGAFFVFVGTWGTIKTSAVKEHFSDERISANEAEAKRSIAESEIAKEGAAKANERAELARLELAKFKAPRNLTKEQSDQLYEVLKPFGEHEYDIAASKILEPGSFLVAQLIELFTRLNWKFLSYDGTLSKQELNLIQVKKLPPEFFAEWPQKQYFAGIVSDQIGIKIFREFQSKTTVDVAFALQLNLQNIGLYTVTETSDHTYSIDERGARIPNPVSEVVHISIGTKQ